MLYSLVLTSFVASALAQTVPIPDEGLDSAIRDALQKPPGPLSQQDLLSLTNLNASHRSIFSLDGLEAARNLISLNLSSNFFENPSIPSTLTKLTTIDLSFPSIARRINPSANGAFVPLRAI